MFRLSADSAKGSGIEEYEIQLFPSAQIMAALKGLCIQHVVTVHKIYVFAGGVQQSPVARDG